MGQPTNSTNTTITILKRLYQWGRALRYSWLLTQFGYISHCPHQPTCGTYFIQTLETEGVVAATVKGSRRVLSCY